MIDFNVNGFIEKVQPAVDAFAQSVGTKADQLWTLGITMEKVKGGFELFIATVCFVVLCFTPRLWKFSSKKCEESNFDGELWYLLPIGTSLIAGAIFFGCLYEGLMRLIVPQYMLIMDILQNIQR